MKDSSSRRSFLQAVGLGAAVFGVHGAAAADDEKQEQVIQGFDEVENDPNASRGWQPVSDRKVRLGIVGYGVCHFGAAFGLQDHPNVEVVAVSDLFPKRCDGLAKACRCDKKYPSLEELVKNDKIEAVFVATDAPSHARHCIEVLKHGKHVATAVPAVWGSIEQADELFETVKTTGLKYMMFETSCFHADNHAMRQIYEAGGFGRLIYSEGEYYHYTPTPLPSYKEWRTGMPPLWYPTHSTAYYIGVTGKTFTSVSCTGFKGSQPYVQRGGNKYNNPFSDEVALFETSEGGMSRMLMCKGTQGKGAEAGRVFGERGWMDGMQYRGTMKELPNLNRPPLPPGVAPGGHGGSHGHLCEEFIRSILEDRRPLVDIVKALNMTVPGVIAHQSALKDGQRMKVPVYQM